MLRQRPAMPVTADQDEFEDFVDAEPSDSKVSTGTDV